MKNKDLVNLIFEGRNSGSLKQIGLKAEVVDFLEQALQGGGDAEVGERKKISRNFLFDFLKKFDRRWSKNQRKKGEFMKKEADWLEETIELEVQEKACEVGKEGKGGRPSIPFDDCTPQSKKRKAEKNNEGKGLNEILMQSYYKLKEEGRIEDAKAIKKILEADEDGAAASSAQYSSKEALALLLDCGYVINE